MRANIILAAAHERDSEALSEADFEEEYGSDDDQDDEEVTLRSKKRELADKDDARTTKAHRTK